MTGKVAALLSAAAVGIGALASAPSAMAVSCWGHWCSGQDPMATGCGADARTIAYRDDIVGARLELRWSPTCKAGWARWHQYPRGWNMGTVPYVIRTVQDTGYTQTLDLGVGGVDDNETVWSPMVYSPKHGIKAEALVSCGDMTLFSTAMDCAMNGKISTDMK